MPDRQQRRDFRGDRPYFRSFNSANRIPPKGQENQSSRNCTICGRIGHRDVDCWYKNKNNQQQVTQRQAVRPTGQGNGGSTANVSTNNAPRMQNVPRNNNSRQNNNSGRPGNNSTGRPGGNARVFTMNGAEVSQENDLVQGFQGGIIASTP
ncbi:hypothetical protein RJT34_19286 [Clitoria ternatea]|uniref:CCHC-type domain-containing protein n=1 Tax=Clitoria ternatea TaxID=43366 RepID=A0AAN9P4H4_CLITE